MKSLFRILLLLTGVTAASSCGPSEELDVSVDEDVGSTLEALTKCQSPGTNGTGNYCDDPACPCTVGEGDCDASSQCIAPYACSGRGTFFGFATNFNVCAGAHCNNKRKDGDETAVDCGGSCGSFNCPADACAGLPANGQTGHCTGTCPCPAGQGACVSNSECQTGLTCRVGFGAAFGFSSATRVCLGNHCGNGVRDGDETGADCGGSCAPCGGSTMSSRALGGTGDDGGLAFAYDSAGNLIVAGRFNDTINLGGADLVSQGLNDIYVAKLSPSGAHVWSRSFGSVTGDADSALELALDNVNNVHIAGNYTGPISFGGATLTPSGTSAAFVVKLSAASGAHQWSRSFGGPRSNRVMSIDVTPAGLVYIVGTFQDSINFGGATLVSANAGHTNDSSDAFVAKLTNAGAHVWSRAFGTVAHEDATDVVSDTAGNVYVAGLFSMTLNFGLGNVTSRGTTDAFGLKLSGTTGATTWARTWGGTADDRTNAVAVGADLNPVFGGRFKRTVNFGSGNVAAVGSDAFIVSCDGTTGATRWSHAFGGAVHDRTIALAVLPSTNAVAAVGLFEGNMNPGLGVLTSAGGLDIFVTRYSASGALAWQRSFGGPGADYGYEIDVFGSLVGISGEFAGTAGFGAAPLVSSGGSDIVLASLAL